MKTTVTFLMECPVPGLAKVSDNSLPSYLYQAYSKYCSNEITHNSD